jgi:adenosine kinase
MSNKEESIINSMIAIGNPIVDITCEIDENSLKKYDLEWGKTVFANEKNVPFFEELEKNEKVMYTTGGSIQNSLRVCSWCINMNETNKNKYKITMLGSVGNDNYKDKIMNALSTSGVNPLFEFNDKMNSSRCGVGIFKKERCLVHEIKASNTLTMDFIDKNLNEILSHNYLVIEGYFLQEKFDICKRLVEEFKKQNKIVIFTCGAVFMVQAHNDKVMEIANKSDMIVGNMEECEAIAGKKGENNEETLKLVHKKLNKNNKRILLMTDGGKGVYVTKFNYDNDNFEFILHSFCNPIKPEEIVDLNGAGDAFLGGFLSQYLQKKSIDICCKAGNIIAGVILRNVGCTYKEDLKFNFDE